MKFEGTHYVVVAEYDSTEALARRLGFKREGPIVHEVCLGETTTREGAERRAASFGTAFGRIRIARLVFEEDTNNNAKELS